MRRTTSFFGHSMIKAPTLYRSAFAGLVVCAGCVSYAPPEVTAMSAYDICEARVSQAWSITKESRDLLERELVRRNESCAAHLEAIHAQRAEELYERMYLNQSP